MTYLEKLKVRRGYNFNRIATMSLINMLKNKVIHQNNVHIEHYKPKHKSFIFICNHTESFDPGYEMVAMNKYMRYVASDHTTRMKTGWIYTIIGGVIVKHRDRPSSELTANIIKNLDAGIPVGLHAEGAMTSNGQTGFISEHTGQLVKDSGAALITYRFVGGYLRKPRWAESSRSGPIIGHFVGEYSPEELAKMSVQEITELIRRDTYVNVYDEQKKDPKEYNGENLAEHVERILYVCPKCNEVGTLHSKGNSLTCDCGYSVDMGTDGLFHDTGSGLIHDNILSWDLWQRDVWKEKVLAAKSGECIFCEEGQIVKKVDGDEDTILTENAKISLYPEKFVVEYDNETITMDMDKIKQVSLSHKDALLIVDDKIFLDIRCHIPRSPNKYIAAWRYLTGKEYY